MTTLVRRSPRIAELNMKKQSEKVDDNSMSNQDYNKDAQAPRQMNTCGSALQVSLMITDFVLTLVHLWFILNRNYDC